MAPLSLDTCDRPIHVIYMPPVASTWPALGRRKTQKGHNRDILIYAYSYNEIAVFYNSNGELEATI